MARITNFSDLNRSCILFIFKFLSLEDQLHLARCCRGFRDAFVQLHRHHFHEVIDRETNLRTLEDWQTFLWLCGGSIRRIQSYFDDDHPLQLLPMISKYCYRLESITINNATVARTQPYLLKISSLRKVHIRNYKSTSKDLIKAMHMRLPHITSLGLESFERRELQEVVHFRNLVELSMYDEVTASEFTAMIKPMSLTLRSLQLRNAKRFLTTSSLRYLASMCRQLEKLSFNDCDADLTALAQFSNLKYLQIYCPEELKRPLFKALASSCSSQLEFLILQRKRWINEEHARHISALKSLKWLVCKPRDDSCVQHLAKLSQLECLSIQCAREIGEQKLSILVANNDQLRYLNICYCLGITDSFVLETLESLAKRTVQPPLLLYAAATDIRHDIMDRLPPGYPLKMLCLTFECSEGITGDNHFYIDEPEFDRQAV